MFVLHVLDGGADGLADATLSIGVLEPGTGRAFDLALREVVSIADEDVVAVAHGGGAFFAPELDRAAARMRPRLVANPPAAPIPFRRRAPLASTGVVTGYTAYAREAALFWRSHGVGAQPVLAAGVFALASIQTGIDNTLKLVALLTPYLVEGKLPDRRTLYKLCKKSGVGLQNSRPDWFQAFERYVPEISNRAGIEFDDDFRKDLCMNTELPKGLSITKLSFVLALLGNNCGCLDARILGWAYGDSKKGSKAASTLSKKDRGRISAGRYEKYRDAELTILGQTPYYDPEDPVGLARAQWMLWEQLGEGGAEYHDHQEFFDTVVEPRFLQLLRA
jgi:hypothetical protein